MKDELFEMRLNLAKSNKSAPWTMDDLVNTLKELKGGKARDPMVGLTRYSPMRLQEKV